MSAFKIAHLEKSQAGKIQALEEELGMCIIALEPGLELAKLSGEQLAKVQEAEKKLGVTLIVYENC